MRKGPTLLGKSPDKTHDLGDYQREAILINKDKLITKIRKSRRFEQ